MRIFLTAILLLAMDLIPRVNMSFSVPPEDLDGSGYDLDSSGSGSGDWSVQDSSSSARSTANTRSEMKKIKNDFNTNGEDRIIAAAAGGGTRNDFHDVSDMMFDNTPWLADNAGSAFGTVAKSKSFLENKEILAGVIAGGVTGLTLAIGLAAIIIYKWQKKDVDGYTLGQQKASNGLY